MTREARREALAETILVAEHMRAAQPCGMEFLKAHRAHYGISQRKMADQLHVHRTTYNSWELQKTSPAAVMLPLIAEALSITIAELYQPPEEVPQE